MYWQLKCRCGGVWALQRSVGLWPRHFLFMAGKCFSTKKVKIKASKILTVAEKIIRHCSRHKVDTTQD